MRAFKHILVPTDFEPASSQAMEIAASLARVFEGKVTLLHVWEIPDYPNLDFMLDSGPIARAEEAAVRRLAEALEILKTLAPSAAAKLKTGPAGRGILDVIEELAPDLVVMGTHARRGLEHALLGSVAEKVVRLSDVPVLTVHAARADR
jgi:nucleotide-binding universal stress UspA family protein